MQLILWLTAAVQRIGIYGGTFDPIHYGHLILARDAMEQLHLERVVFVPAALSPHKLEGASAPAMLRVEMLWAAIAGEPRFSVDEVELQRPGPSFTIDTIEQFKRRDPGLEICYLIGADNVGRLQTWHRIDDLLTQVTLVVLQRGAAEPATAFQTINRRIEISATEIRNRVASGQSVRYLVPPPVAELIEHHQLYQEPNR